MIKHKKVTRTLIAVFMALCLFMGPLASKPKAATAGSGTAVSGSTTVCSYSWTFVNNGIYDIGTNLGIIKSSMHVDIELTAYYSGALTITLSGTQSFANIGIFVKGGYLAATSSNQCKIQLIANVSHVEVDFISSIEFTSVPNWSVTVSASGINKIDDLEHTSLDNIDDYTGRISAAITSTTNGLPAIYNALDSIDDAINLLLQQSIKLQQLQNYFPDYNLQGYLWGISYGGFSTLYDSQIPYALVGNSVNDSQYTNIHRILKSKDHDSVFYFIADYWLNDSLINILWQDTRFSSSYHVEVKQWYSSDNPNAYHALYLCKLTVISNNTFDNGYEVEFNLNSLNVYPLYIGNPDMIPDNLALLLGTDFSNTYTRLLQQISDGIAGIEADQTVIDNSTTINNNYNTELTKINNIEVNILTGIDNKFTDVNTAIDQSGVINGSINNTGIGWANYYSGIVLDNLTIVKYPVYIILIGFVLLCLLG